MPRNLQFHPMTEVRPLLKEHLSGHRTKIAELHPIGFLLQIHTIIFFSIGLAGPLLVRSGVVVGGRHR